MPGSLQAQLSPSNAIGEIVRYTLRGPGYSLRELKTANDWILAKEFRRVPGVIDLVSYAGRESAVLGDDAKRTAAGGDSKHESTHGCCTQTFIKRVRKQAPGQPNL